MPIHNANITVIFKGIADLLEIEGANPFRIRAYRTAARVVGEYSRELRALLAQGADLPKLPGIGADLSGKISEIVTTGHCALRERLRGEIPASVTELLKIPGLGAKKVSALYHDLTVETPEQLLRMAHEERIRQLHGFSEKTEASILQAIEAHGNKARRYPLSAATQYATALLAYLQRVPGVHQVTLAGSYRRRRETVGDLHILASAASASPVIQRFLVYDEVAEVLSGGTTRASVILKSGLQVGQRLVEDVSYGAALQYFTGSNTVLRSAPWLRNAA